VRAEHAVGKHAVTRSDLRIATVYTRRPVGPSEIHAMDRLRWLRISEGLADLGFSVDMIVEASQNLGSPRPTLRSVSPSRVDWSVYHVVKTLYPMGFRTLRETGGEEHPFILSRVGGVVGPTDSTPGVYFFGEERQALWEAHLMIRERARYVTLITDASRALWQAQHGLHPPVIMVPTGVDREIPPPGRNPFAGSPLRTAVYIGNLYPRDSQPELNLQWQERLNRLGARLLTRGIRLYFVGPGLTERLDERMVTTVGPISHELIWDYQYFADVGIVLARGAVQIDDASKLYYYLRAGLPVVSEAPVPNNHLITESGLGYIAPYNDDVAMVEMIDAAARRLWDRRGAQGYVLAHHTWEHRARVYERILSAEFGV
jgi:glycosyltransferase involved in cell wall biosynthesis